ncbi:MAG TPA: ATP-dependent DNA ligase [Chthoniobacterales bacterium]|nr:ATP-dependent DNA ligase [Chthoniobacterales bacterium]
MLNPPIEPMEAVQVDDIPEDGDWQYEPKWDGFRCLIFRRDRDVYLQSKAGQPLGRYFPEIVRAAEDLKPKWWVLDGELALPVGLSFSFDQLLQRIHPAASRITRLAKETPAIYIAFDLLMVTKQDILLDSPLSKRRRLLEEFSKNFRTTDRFRLSPNSLELKQVRAWFKEIGNNLDGVVCKQRDSGYVSGVSAAFQKVKNYRSIDCVVGGFRYATNGNGVGSLLLGLYDDKGKLNHVGFTSGIKASERKSLAKRLEKIIDPPGFDGNAPGGKSRWAPQEPREWKPLRPELVVEVCYDHFTGGRFRHGTRLLRWRPDKAPRQCRYTQLPKPSGKILELLQETKR